MCPISSAHTCFLTYIYWFPNGQLWNTLCISTLSLSLFLFPTVKERRQSWKYTRIAQIPFQLKSCVYWECVHDWAPSWAPFAGRAERQFCADSNGERSCQFWSFTLMTRSPLVYFYTRYNHWLETERALIVLQRSLLMFQSIDYC